MPKDIGELVANGLLLCMQLEKSGTIPKQRTDKFKSGTQKMIPTS